MSTQDGVASGQPLWEGLGERAATAGAFAGLRQRQCVTTEWCGRQLLRFPPCIWVGSLQHRIPHCHSKQPFCKEYFSFVPLSTKESGQTPLFCLVSRYHLDETVGTFGLYVHLHHLNTISDIISSNAFVLLSTEVFFSIRLSSLLHSVDTLVPATWVTGHINIQI